MLEGVSKTGVACLSNTCEETQVFIFTLRLVLVTIYHHARQHSCPALDSTSKRDISAQVSSLKGHPAFRRLQLQGQLQATVTHDMFQPLCLPRPRSLIAYSIDTRLLMSHLYMLINCDFFTSLELILASLNATAVRESKFLISNHAYWWMLTSLAKRTTLLTRHYLSLVNNTPGQYNCGPRKPRLRP